jgi:very-short-patch-repair endonuclease
MTETNRYPLALRCLQAIRSDACAELRFHPERKWRFDLAVPSARIAIEIDGGVWTGGRHSRGAGQVADMEKANAAQLLGWRLFRFTPQQVKSGAWLQTIRTALQENKP